MNLNCVNKTRSATGGVGVKKKEEMSLKKTVAYNHKNYKRSLWIHRQNLQDYQLLRFASTLNHPPFMIIG